MMYHQIIFKQIINHDMYGGREEWEYFMCKKPKKVYNSQKAKTIERLAILK